MKLSRVVMMGLVVVGSCLLLLSVSFADEAQEKAKVEILNSSAAAIKESNPDLSAALSKFANEEEKEIGKMDEKEPEGKEEKMDEKAAGADIKLLKDAAYALRISHPDFSKGLIKIAREEKMELKGEQKEDKEEVGEEVENEIRDKK